MTDCAHAGPRHYMAGIGLRAGLALEKAFYDLRINAGSFT